MLGDKTGVTMLYIASCPHPPGEWVCVQARTKRLRIEVVAKLVGQAGDDAARIACVTIARSTQQTTAAPEAGSPIHHALANSGVCWPGRR
ncbi:MAG: hypothetical protein R2705_09270 [Ilumatobacteraceae bacterium]